MSSRTSNSSFLGVLALFAVLLGGGLITFLLVRPSSPARFADTGGAGQVFVGFAFGLMAAALIVVYVYLRSL